MADNPQKPGHARPLSPHLTVYRWQMTMLGSIVHRLTGMGLAVGALALAWWLVAISNGPESFEFFESWATTPLGLVLLFGFTWALGFHLLNGVRHLAWDLGYGFDKHVATQTATLVFILSLLIAVGVFALAWTGHAGYLS
jgi:succinate dehydrogenase / fumarate reductase cytochrome b subunit